jgi:hypothetical protein
MTRNEIEETWRSKPLQCWGHVACWDDEGHARPGAAMTPQPSASALAFRRLILEINKRRQSRRSV